MAIATAPEPPLSHISARRLAFIERFYLVATGRLLVLRIRPVSVQSVPMITWRLYVPRHARSLRERLPNVGAF